MSTPAIGSLTLVGCLRGREGGGYSREMRREANGEEKRSEQRRGEGQKGLERAKAARIGERCDGERASQGSQAFKR